MRKEERRRFLTLVLALLTLLVFGTVTVAAEEETGTSPTTTETTTAAEETTTAPAEVTATSITKGIGKGSDGNWYYFTDGKVDTSKNTIAEGLVDGTTGWWLIRDGVVARTTTTVAENEHGWWFCKNGQVDFSFTGFASNEYGVWRIEKGKVNFKYSDIIETTINGTKGWWYIYNGKVRTNETTVAQNKFGWWYVKNGMVDFTYTGVARNQYGWWRIENGKVNFNYNGLAMNEHGWWLLKGGKVNFDYTGLYPNDAGWWLLQKGKVNFSYTGNYDYYGTTYSLSGGKVTGAPGKRIIYLTFDDGPYQYTDQLLGILAKYHVPATFFVTSAYPSYAYDITLERQQGHMVAVHTYTHNYATIYSSDSAYWNDFNRMNNVIKQRTGTTTSLFRFPGGSSNTVSRSYSSGIMSRLSTQATQKGYQYFDWNVMSGDAGGVTSTSGCYNNMVNGCKYMNVSVVLCHDVKGYSVNAIEPFIQWAQSNGYAFMPLCRTSPTAHQSISN